MHSQTIPALPNHYPYNELLLDGKLSAKTRSWRWRHTGLTLLYTSTGTDHDVVQAHQLERTAKTAPRGVIVGVGELLPVRRNTHQETRRILREFSNRGRGTGWFGASPYRYEFRNLRRFKNPVPFRPPQGAVRLFNIPVALVARELRRVGIRLP